MNEYQAPLTNAKEAIHGYLQEINMMWPLVSDPRTLLKLIKGRLSDCYIDGFIQGYRSSQKELTSFELKQLKQELQDKYRKDCSLDEEMQHQDNIEAIETVMKLLR